MIYSNPKTCHCNVCEQSFVRPRNRGVMDTCSPCQRKRRLIEWKKRNADKKRESNRRWAQQNAEKNKLIKAEWAKNNPAIEAAKQARRRARKVSATPPWANHFFISQAYELAQIRTKQFGFEWHVDHIIPLQGEVVCGLHVETNLQVIPGKQNIMKSNRFEGNP